MEKKRELVLKGLLFTFINVALIDTSYNVLGVIFGVVGAIHLISSLTIKKN